MEVKIIETGKKNYLDLLLLADEQENMIDKYLDNGTFFALYDDDLKSVCVVTDEGMGVFEIQNLATYERYQRKGYGGYLLNYVCHYYQGVGRIMRVGTGDSPGILLFYKKYGFVFSHRVENYFVEHYDKPMFENGIPLKDKIYLKRTLC